MKKLLKVLSLMVISIALVVGIVAFAGCGGNKDDGSKTYTGEYHYNAWNTEYGIKVNVKVKDNTIQNVAIVKSDYVEVSDGWENKATWNDGVANLLKVYEGKSIFEVSVVYGQIKGVVPEGAPDGYPAPTEDSISNKAYAITGATQGSVRLLNAVQNALTKIEKITLVGEYHYNAWNTEYGIKVQVTYTTGAEGKIESVKILKSDYVEVSEGWENKATWNDGIANLLKAYEGKKVTDIMSATGTIKNVEDATEDSLSNADLKITGATQGSVRLLKAIQNAFLSVQPNA